MNWKAIYDHMDERQRLELLLGMFKRLRWARLLDAYADLPYAIRRRLFTWSLYTFVPAHWVR